MQLPVATLETLKALVLIVNYVPKPFYVVYNKKAAKISGKKKKKIHQRQFLVVTQMYFANFVDSPV